MTIRTGAEEEICVSLKTYLAGLRAILERIEREQAENITRAGLLVADALNAGGVIHTFGTGHSHLIAEEAFFRAGGLTPVNPILDERLIFLEGALESTRAERESGLASQLIERENISQQDAVIIISNSGRNATPIEMGLEMKSMGLGIIVITNLEQSCATASRHASGKRLFEIADVTVDNCTPTGDALLSLSGLDSRIGATSTVAGAAIINSIMIEAASELLRRGRRVPILPSANLESVTEEQLLQTLRPYRMRIRYFRDETGEDVA
jgi:uncharacterized phosphosugar-binding protein